LFLAVCCEAVAQQDTVFSIYFGSNKWEADSLQLDRFDQFLSAVESVKQVTGYADSIGTRSYNLNLSRLRAEYVAVIIRRREGDKQLSLRYLGEDGQTGKDLQLDRRVEIIGSLKEKTLTPVERRPPTAEGEIIKTVSVENIYFLPDRAIVTEESISYVKDLANILAGYDKANQFEIVGHVNYQSRLDSSGLKDLYELSLQRARVVYDLLVEYGIQKERLTYRGAGNSEPIIANPKNDEEKRKNMRVEVNIR